MKIYVEELRDVDGDLRYMPLINYNSDFIPRRGESLFFTHFGLFVVTDVIYKIADDCTNNECMWIEVRVEKVFE